MEKMETHAAQSRVGAIQGVQRIQRQPRGILEIKGGQSFNTEIEEWLVDFEKYYLYQFITSFWNSYIWGKYVWTLFYVGDIKEKILETVDMLRSWGGKIAHFSQSLKIYIMMEYFKMLAQ